jgi:hypothetical protein
VGSCGSGRLVARQLRDYGIVPGDWGKLHAVSRLGYVEALPLGITRLR